MLNKVFKKSLTNAGLNFWTIGAVNVTTPPPSGANPRDFICKLNDKYLKQKLNTYFNTQIFII